MELISNAGGDVPMSVKGRSLVCWGSLWGSTRWRWWELLPWLLRWVKSGLDASGLGELGERDPSRSKSGILERLSTVESTKWRGTRSVDSKLKGKVCWGLYFALVIYGVTWTWGQFA
uniref:Uncharacterized protein n=1 Tax=Candidozyma auris TaxID=498019 RepID=A0A0L0P1W5_CANAR